MSVPNHGSFCRSLTYPVKCWTCQNKIYIFQCSCGSTVLFDRLGSPWPIHDCGGEKLPTGWDAIRKLESMGVAIDQRVYEYAFGKKQKRPDNTSPLIVRVDPENGDKLEILAILRDLNDTTKVINSLNEFGVIGFKILGLKNNEKVAQVTFHDTTKSQAESYTCLIPSEISISDSDIGKLIGVSLRGVVSGSMRYWVVSGINVL